MIVIGAGIRVIRVNIETAYNSMRARIEFPLI